VLLQANLERKTIRIMALGEAEEGSVSKTLQAAKAEVLEVLDTQVVQKSVEVPRSAVPVPVEFLHLVSDYNSVGPVPNEAALGGEVESGVVPEICLRGHAESVWQASVVLERLFEGQSVVCVQVHLDHGNGRAKGAASFTARLKQLGSKGLVVENWKSPKDVNLDEDDQRQAGQEPEKSEKNAVATSRVWIFGPDAGKVHEAQEEVQRMLTLLFPQQYGKVSIRHARPWSDNRYALLKSRQAHWGCKLLLDRRNMLISICGSGDAVKRAKELVQEVDEEAAESEAARLAEEKARKEEEERAAAARSEAERLAAEAEAAARAFAADAEEQWRQREAPARAPRWADEVSPLDDPCYGGVWYYVDDSYTIQGPFPDELMEQWYLEDWFPSYVPVAKKHPRDGLPGLHDFVPLSALESRYRSPFS